jgi:hypothetical protein
MKRIFKGGTMKQEKIDNYLKLIQTWAEFEYREINAGQVDIEKIKTTLKAIANRAATALDREDLRI